ncbi:hypothetical protein BC936DRAFT_147715 [Jimgerdemannia flammicorona]|uniref:SAM domain-containing protein n=1 Tax=Jimgerdemannia flammicorona TaxID=994334 RepID=A0A433D4U3_9FUNG|nr:hypothetical protein BC936DRAFT_147715 [Jimgerdemannia flammicorona]
MITRSKAKEEQLVPLFLPQVSVSSSSTRPKNTRSSASVPSLPEPKNTRSKTRGKGISQTSKLQESVVTTSKATPRNSQGKGLARNHPSTSGTTPRNSESKELARNRTFTSQRRVQKTKDQDKDKVKVRHWEPEPETRHLRGSVRQGAAEDQMHNPEQDNENSHTDPSQATLDSINLLTFTDRELWMTTEKKRGRKSVRDDVIPSTSGMASSTAPKALDIFKEGTVTLADTVTTKGTGSLTSIVPMSESNVEGERRKRRSQPEISDEDEIMMTGAFVPEVSGRSAPAARNPSISEIKSWETDHVIKYLRSIFPEKDISNEDMDIIRNHQIGGRAFLNLTLEGLFACGMKLGPASNIMAFVKKLNEDGERPAKKSRTGISKTYSGEGVDELCHISDQRMAKIDARLTETVVNLLRSPPASGKTTLSQLLKIYLEGKHRKVVRISMLNLAVGNSLSLKDEINFDAFWTRLVGESWTDLLNCKMPTDVIIDEAQILYGTRVPFFWAGLKELKAEKSNPNLRVFLLSMYDNQQVASRATPIDFPKALGLDDLRLLRNEFDIVVKKFGRLHAENDMPFEIPANVCDIVFNATRGHPGLVRLTLQCLRRESRRSVETLTYLASPGYWNAIRETRALGFLKQLELSAVEEKFLRDALCSVDPDSTFIPKMNIEPTMSIIENFLYSGLITYADKGGMQFPAPLVRVILGQRLYSAPMSISNEQDKAIDFTSFLCRSIERMRPSVLRKQLKMDQRLYERAWQMEWYHAATTVVPGNATIIPYVRSVFNSSSFLDFYVNTELQWGVELLRDGKGMKEHGSLFDQGGKYGVIPLKQWAIIDFRQHSKKFPPLRPRCWYAFYADNYNKISLVSHDKTTVKLTLRGDDMMKSRN